MSAVSRSVYQKLKEENKRLLADLYVISMKPMVQAIPVIDKWKQKFSEDAEFNKLLKEACIQYLKNHPELDIAKRLSHDKDSKKDS